MKNLIVLVSLLFAANTMAGMTGDKIHFQKASSWVSVVVDKSLCFDGTTYYANVTKCLDRDEDGDCNKWGKVPASQPASSTRQLCSYDEDGDVKSCKTVAYNQSPVKVVTFTDEDDRVTGTKTYRVKSCN